MLDITREDVLRLYYYMKLTRKLEDRFTSLYHQGRILGGAWTSNGMEAISVGYSYAMAKDDVVAPYFRDMGVFLVRGITVKRIMAQYFGKKTGVTHGKEGNVHMGDLDFGVFSYPSHLADNYPVGTGAALAFKIRGEKRIAVACTGDGGTSRGDFHEGMNLASVRKLPIVFICNNNQYAYSTPIKLQMAIKDVAERALAYGIPGKIVDGNNVMEVFTTAKEAYELARNGGGPTFIECKTMRMHGHSEHDSAKYVPQELLDEWKKKDPIVRMEKYFAENNIAGKQELDGIEVQIKKEIDEAEAFAVESPYPEPEECFRGLYASPIEEGDHGTT